MRLHVFLAVSATFLLVAADAPKDDAAQQELKKLTGTWTMVSGEDDGKKLSEETVKAAKLTLMGDKHTVLVGKDKIVGTHKIDPTKKPKTIDATDTEGPFKGQTTLGIYELDGDNFKVCFAPAGKDRPKEFSAKAGSGQFIHVWKRQKE